MWQLKQICKSLGVTLVQSFALDIPAFDTSDDRFVEEYPKKLDILQRYSLTIVERTTIPVPMADTVTSKDTKDGQRYINEQINNSYYKFWDIPIQH